MKHGLRRALVLEAIVFVPASVGLFLLTVFPAIEGALLELKADLLFWYSIGGLISYGFPFAAVRQIITRIALRTLRDFASIAAGNERNSKVDPTRRTDTKEE